MDLSSFRQKAQSAKKANHKFLEKLRHELPEDLDENFQSFHEEAFSEINCLDCANCCKTTSPIFRSVDIARLSRFLRMRPAAFTETYLRVDEDGDYVLKSSPCPFLEKDNRCSVYDSRPIACREYPHTDRKNIHQIFDLTLKNSMVCPAVFLILEKMRKL